MRCCANCEWSISPELEDEIMEEQRYEYDDSNRPIAGDCVLGNIHDKNFYCPSHTFEGEEIHLFYDQKYLVPGFLIITTAHGEMENFMKFGLIDAESPQFLVRGYEREANDDSDQKFRTIRIDIEQNHPLFKPLEILAEKIGDQKVYSIDSYEQGKNNIQIIRNEQYITIELHKDVFGVRHATNFIDILLGDHDTCPIYKELLSFYKDLSSPSLSVKNTTEKDIKRFLLCSKH